MCRYLRGPAGPSPMTASMSPRAAVAILVLVLLASAPRPQAATSPSAPPGAARPLQQPGSTLAPRGAAASLYTQRVTGNDVKRV
ncbi:MAG: hypothetical protein J3K34DRAFT_430808 [Monoraphidium minutum]|nr:MAG: hypothetical protein J3K34DRAFT_430808 [Monoraphidium minutum]